MHSSDVDFADEEGFETQEGAHMIINKAMELAGIMGESVAETKTDDDAGEEIKEQSPELARLKQLIGIDPVREMKQ